MEAACYTQGSGDFLKFPAVVGESFLKKGTYGSFEVIWTG